MSNTFWNMKYSDRNYEWGPDPSAPGRLAVGIARKYGYANILDIGCGYGRNALYIASNGMDVTGIDYSKAGIDMANETADRLGINAKFILADVLEYPFERECYDIAIMSYTRHLLPSHDRLKLIDKIEHLLRHGGRVIDMVPSVRDENYGMGRRLEKGTYLLRGKKVHYSSHEEAQRDYTGFVLENLNETEIEEKHSDGRVHNHWTWIVIALKE